MGTITEELNPRYLLARVGLVAIASADGGAADPGQAAAYGAQHGWRALDLAGSPLLPGDMWDTGTSLAVVAQKSSGRLHGYSALRADTWVTHPDPVVSGNQSPLVAGNVAVLRVGASAYAFGAECGGWHALHGVTDAPRLSANLAVVLAGGDVHAFSAIRAAGAWVSPPWSAGDTGALVVSEPGTNVALAGRVGGRPWAFDAVQGSWLPLPSSTPSVLSGSETLHAYSHVALVLQRGQGGWMHAFSVNTHAWTSLQVSSDVMEPVCAGNVAVVRTDRGDYAFTGVVKPLRRPGLPPGWHEPIASGPVEAGLSA